MNIIPFKKTIINKGIMNKKVIKEKCFTTLGIYNILVGEYFTLVIDNNICSSPGYTEFVIKQIKLPIDQFTNLNEITKYLSLVSCAQ